ncbi:acyl-CoA ligase (AMP-forming), exosortase A-associated [Sphingomonas laterariae]|uniref:Acyl-CoA ligase (AMP-forming), exosortase A-associated n=1 Tax=Edaphosphingomonas laterariae TaxID=861865 RepID=A0A239DND7_9SPHN|nr:acyl-CoA ligase (AMP-forming), exosortase A system-associated [Sphingomonas laterariae]SNS33368.1 acyl-CoA ligase (AMP-forming), exosortase A-associated [Sphingomonas laterariae]
MTDQSAAPDATPRPLDHLAAMGAPDALALVDRAGALSFTGLDRAVGALARALDGRGLAKGARVASWLAKTRLASLLPLACARAELVHVPINPLLKRGQVAHILQDSGASLLIAGAGRSGTLEAGDRPADCALLIEDEAGAASLAAQDGLPASAADPDALAAILYTSGSTGRPKGVMLSHANLWLGAVSVAHYLRLTADDRTLAVLPFSFDYGQNQLLSSWAAGACVYPLDYLTARDVIRAVDKHEITTLAGVPPLWVQLAEADWPEATAGRLRRITNSGGRLPVPLVHRLRQLFPAADLYSMYGLTEAFRSTYLDPALIDTHPDSIGGAIPFAEVMLVRPDGGLAATGEPGELVHAGPLVAQGYWQDAERTALRFRPAPVFSKYGGMAVWSGDTAVMDADGLLRFVGRDDEMIKTSGNRVSPTEVEEAAVATGAAAEAVAIGVPDDRLGEAILLVVRGDPAGEGALRDGLKRDLPNFMQPREIRWRADLPRNANGKVDRAGLKAELTS